LAFAMMTRWGKDEKEKKNSIEKDARERFSTSVKRNERRRF